MSTPPPRKPPSRKPKTLIDFTASKVNGNKGRSKEVCGVSTKTDQPVRRYSALGAEASRGTKVSDLHKRFNSSEETRAATQVSTFTPELGFYYGQLKVLSLANVDAPITGDSLYKCQCVCGQPSMVTAVTLRRSPSCRHTGSTEGLKIRANNTLYRRWHALLRLNLYTPTALCDEWRSFHTFKEDAVTFLEPRQTLVRINNLLPWSKTNVVCLPKGELRYLDTWAYKQVIVNGVTNSLLGLALRYGVPLRKVNTYYNNKARTEKLSTEYYIITTGKEPLA